MKCPHCGRDLLDLPRIPFKATCDHCSAYLHSCKNCRHYKVGMPNDCLIPGTEPVADRESANYCEEFSLKTPLEKKSAPSDAVRKLFGDDDIPPKRDFGSLFK